MLQAYTIVFVSLFWIGLIGSYFAHERGEQGGFFIWSFVTGMRFQSCLMITAFNFI